MHKKPDTSAYLDEGERELMEAIELGGYKPGCIQKFSRNYAGSQIGY